MIMELMNNAVSDGVNKYEYVHSILKRQLKLTGFDTDLIDWSKEPEGIAYEVQKMIDEIKADEEWENQNAV